MNIFCTRSRVFINVYIFFIFPLGSRQRVKENKKFSRDCNLNTLLVHDSRNERFGVREQNKAVQKVNEKPKKSQREQCIVIINVLMWTDVTTKRKVKRQLTLNLTFKNL